MGLPILKELAELIASPIKDLTETRKIRRTTKVEMMKELVVAETKVAIAKAEAEADIAKKKAEAVFSWENTMADASKTSWKDEYWTIVLSIPAILCFVPGLAGYMAKGFAVLEQTPEWYRWAMLCAIGGAFGLRALTKLKP